GDGRGRRGASRHALSAGAGRGDLRFAVPNLHGAVIAGIGWKLERMLDRDTLGSSAGAFLTGVAVTSGPWLLTTLALVLVRLTASGGGVGPADRVVPGASAGVRL